MVQGLRVDSSKASDLEAQKCPGMGGPFWGPLFVGQGPEIKG